MLKAFILLCILPGLAWGTKPTVVYLNSYHPGYRWSDMLYQSFSNEIMAKGIEVHQHFMDSKNLETLADHHIMVKNALAYIDYYKPDVIVAADDNASKFIIEPHFKNNSIPVVFLGVNLSSSVYGYPYQNATGIEELEGLNKLLQVVEHYTAKTRFAMLFTKTTTSQKKFQMYQKLAPHLTAITLDDMEDLKRQILGLSQSHDFILLDTMEGLAGYKETLARDFLQKNANVPLMTVSNSSQRLVNFGYLKVPQEQGLWAATSVMKILDGTPAHKIPIAQNTHFQLFINQAFNDKAKAKTPNIFYNVPHVTLD